MRTLPLTLSVLLFACIEPPPDAESTEADASVADAATRSTRRAPADATRRTPPGRRDDVAPPPAMDAGRAAPDPAPPAPARTDAAPPPAADAAPPPAADAAPAPDDPVDRLATCDDACADDRCAAPCAALAAAVTPAALTTWAECMADDAAADPRACLAALDCGPADAIVGQHCDAIGRCESEGRGWFDEAACREDPYPRAAVWRCLRPERRADLVACLAGSTCDALDTCLRYAACADDTVCPELLDLRLTGD